MTEWLASLVGKDGTAVAKGDKGDKGDTGAAGEKGDKGDKGETGASGKSAYELACDNGYSGTLQDWLASLVGAAGAQGDKGEAGATGKSAYEIAKEHGYTGTEEEWIASLVGAKGDTGAKGEKGDAGEQGEKGEKGEKGDDGKDGNTPYIGANGNWWIGDVDTGVKAAGSDGAKGDTGAKGDKGDAGENGKDGDKGEKGDKGETGEQGVSVINAYVDENLHLWLELSNGTKIDAGYVGVSVTPPATTEYTVTFVDWDGTELKKGNVEKGKSATAPADPARDGYIFAGWDKAFDNVTENITVTATYTQITDPTIVIGNATGSIGGEVEITFDLLNSPQLYAMSLQIGFDETALELVSATSGDTMKDFSYTEPKRLKNGSNFIWDKSDAATANGTVLKMVFRIKDTASAGSYSVTMTCDSGNTYDINNNDVELKIVAGSIIATK